MKRYKSHFSGKGHPELILGTTVTSRQSNLFNHVSTGSPTAYLIDSFNDSSTRTREVGVLDEILLSPFTLCRLNCSINFNDNERPVPSYLH